MKDQTKKWLEYAEYPMGGILPDFEPDMLTCVQCAAIADRLRESVRGLLSQSN